jgi:hypothetical protein
MKKKILTVFLILLAVILSGCGPEIDVDIKPRSCPNPLNVKSKDVLPVAILGTEDFDVFDVDVTAITLLGVPPIPVCIHYEDVSRPVEDRPECECTDAGPDGYLDLVLKFDTQEIVAAIETLAEAFDQVPIEDGEQIPLMLFEGEVPDPDDPDTWDDMHRWGYDCVIIRKKGID